MKIWLRFLSTWRELSNGWRISLAMLLVGKLTLALIWFFSGQPLVGLMFVTTTVALMWLLGIGRDPAASESQIDASREF